MGNDGGSIPTRSDLVKENSKGPTTSDIFQSKQLDSADLWTSCALSGKLLQDPIVSDYKGRLYNKESILEYLLTPEKFGIAQKVKMKHINSIKDIVELKISRDKKTSSWICPLTEKDVVKESNSQKFIYIVECGHVMTDKALRETQQTSTTHNCPICDEEYSDTNLITVNPTTQDVIDKAEQRMDRLVDLGLAHSLKEKKKKKNSKRKSQTSANNSKKKMKSTMVPTSPPAAGLCPDT